MSKIPQKKLEVPLNWHVAPLGDLLISSDYGTSKSTNESEGVPVLGMSNINDGKVTVKNTKFVELSNEEIEKLKLNREDLLFNRTNSYEHIGKTGIFNSDGEYIFASYLVRLITDKNKVLPKFLNYYMNTEDSRRKLKRLATQGVQQVNINPSTLKRLFYVRLPQSLEEQQKISEILTSWEKAIELKDKLIEKKTTQKKGLMQKLLTGDVRTPGFNEKWREVKLGDVLKERKEVGFNELELLAITSSKGVVKRTEVDIKDNSSEDKSKYKRICPNDIGYNTMRMWQGVSGVSKYEGIVSPAYTILKPNKVDPLFMGYLFKLPKVIDLFRRHSQGLVNDTLNLKYSNFKAIKVRIPSDINEQLNISKILQTLDKEIDLLVKEKETLIDHKRGLMQLLLTGKVRVNV